MTNITEFPPDRSCGFTWLAKGPWPLGSVVLAQAPLPWRPSTSVATLVESRWAKRDPHHRMFDGPLARLLDFQAHELGLTLRLQATSYRWFWGTNVIEPGLPVNERANPVGTSALVITRDGYAVMGRRAPHLALYPGKIHPFGGCIEDSRQTDLGREIQRELTEELGILSEQLQRIDILGLGQDHALAQPEVMAVAVTDKSRDELVAGLDADEHSQLWACPLSELFEATVGEAAQFTPIALHILTALTPIVKHYCGDGVPVWNRQ